MRSASLAFAAALLTTALPAKADCAADFQAIMQHAGREAGPFRIDEEATAGPLRMVTVSEVIPPDAAHISVTTPQSDQEVIITDGQAWGKIKGFWLPLDEGTVRQMRKDYAQTGILYSDKASNIACLGEKTVDGTTYLAFGYDAAIANFKVPMTVYVDPASRLPVRAEGETRSGDDTARFSATYKPVADLKIAPPPKP